MLYKADAWSNKALNQLLWFKDSLADLVDLVKKRLSMNLELYSSIAYWVCSSSGAEQNRSQNHSKIAALVWFSTYLTVSKKALLSFKASSHTVHIGPDGPLFFNKLTRTLFSPISHVFFNIIFSAIFPAKPCLQCIFEGFKMCPSAVFKNSLFTCSVKVVHGAVCEPTSCPASMCYHVFK